MNNIHSNSHCNYNTPKHWQVNWVKTLLKNAEVQIWSSVLKAGKIRSYAENVFLMKGQAVRLCLKCDGTRAETRFRLSTKRTSPFKSAGASVQSTTGRRAVHVSLQGLYCSCKPAFWSHVTLKFISLQSIYPICSEVTRHKTEIVVCQQQNPLTMLFWCEPASLLYLHRNCESNKCIILL